MSNYHIPVLLKRSIDELVLNTDGIYIDLTFGGGGHSKEILKRLSAKGSLIVFDQDGESVDNIINDSRLTLVKSNFKHLYRFWKWMDIEKVDGILADLGVSSHQFDSAERGFSYRYDAELDMRMNENASMTAGDILANYSMQELQNIFSKYGEIRNAKTLAARIVEKRKSGMAIVSTEQLNEILSSVCFGDKIRYYSQVYQALRIEVNDELDALEKVLADSLKVLKKGGRMVFISYHSLEDRIVKKFLKSGSPDGKVIKDDYGKVLKEIASVGKLIIPDDEEIKENPRARSAKMRIGQKI